MKAEYLSSSGTCKNTDRELWREHEGDYYSDSIHVTEHGGIGINCGGAVFIKSLKSWWQLAQDKLTAEQGLIETGPPTQQTTLSGDDKSLRGEHQRNDSQCHASPSPSQSLDELKDKFHWKHGMLANPSVVAVYHNQEIDAAIDAAARKGNIIGYRDGLKDSDQWNAAFKAGWKARDDISVKYHVPTPPKP